MYKFIIQKPYMELLLILLNETQNLRECSRKAGMDYCRVSQIMQQFHIEGLVNKTLPSELLKGPGRPPANSEQSKKDNSYSISLTERGKRIANLLVQVKNIIEEDKNGKPTEPSKAI